MIYNRLYNISGNIQTDDMRLWNNLSEWSGLVINVKIFRIADFFQTEGYLFLKSVFVCRLHKIIFNKLHGDGIAKGFDTIFYPRFRIRSLEPSICERIFDSLRLLGRNVFAMKDFLF